MKNKLGCRDCAHWQGRTDLNKCNIKPDILPDWFINDCKNHKLAPYIKLRCLANSLGAVIKNREVK